MDRSWRASGTRHSEPESPGRRVAEFRGQQRTSMWMTYCARDHGAESLSQGCSSGSTGCCKKLNAVNTAHSLVDRVGPRRGDRGWTAGCHARARGGFGQIALLRRVRRTATIQAASELRRQALASEHFLPVITGFTPSVREAGTMVDAVLDRFSPGRAPDDQPG
jgi:hypothetical protein